MANNRKEKIGSVYYDKKDKKWKCTYYIFEQEIEKRKYKCFSTVEDAKNFLTSIQYQKGNKLFIQNNGIPINLLMRENLQNKLDLNLIGERTYLRISQTIKTIEKSPISHKNINEITSEDIQSYFITLKHYSNSTIRKIREQFTQIFNISVNKGYITKNPMFGVITPKSDQIRYPIQALEIEEQQRLTDYLLNSTIEEIPLKVAYLMQMYMGLRIGEALALRSTDIDLQRNVVIIDKTLSINKSGKIIMKYLPKTYSGVREVPIPIFIRNEIINQMKLAENNFDKQLFLDNEGNYVRPSNANRDLKEIGIKLGIKDLTTHRLRHTFGTRCIEAGMRAVALQRLLGHADIQTTLNTYASVFERYKKSELEKVNNYYMDNEIIMAISNGTVDLSKEDLSKIENEFEKVKSEYYLIGKPYTEMSSSDLKNLIVQIDKFQEELEQLQYKLNYYITNQSSIELIEPEEER